MIEWRRVPWTLWAYSAITLLGVILIEIGVHGQAPTKVLFPFVMATWLYFLLKGVRWVWIVTLAVSILGLAGSLIAGSLTWHGFASGLVEPVLLLLPVTRRYFEGAPAVAGA